MIVAVLERSDHDAGVEQTRPVVERSCRSRLLIPKDFVSAGTPQDSMYPCSTAYTEGCTRHRPFRRRTVAVHGK